MATFQEFMKVADVAIKDKTSGKRMRQIMRIMRKYHVTRYDLTPEKAVQVLEALGPTYVKIGQLASTRSDMLPKEYCEAFEKLHDEVSPLPFDQIINRINESYGHPWNEVFLAIDPTPLGSASIAQVHRAVLLDGRVVAVKVRRPGVAQKMAEDITMMKRALATAELLLTSEHKTVLMNLENFLKVLEKTTEAELDFSRELDHLIRFREEAIEQGWRGVTSPIPYPQFSNDAVLVMEYVQGIEIDRSTQLRERGFDMDELAMRLVQNYVSQVLDDGFFQADPHAGNVIVRGDAPGQIVWIDLGMTGELTASERQLVGRMFRSVVTRNAYDLMEAVVGISKQHGEVNHGQLLARLAALLEKYGNAELADINLGTVFTEIVEVLRDQNLIMQPAVTMLVRGFVTIEGVIDNIAPRTNVIDVVSEHVLQQSLNPKHLEMRATGIATQALGSAEALTKLPAQASSTLDMLGRGELGVKMDMKIREDALATIYASVGRLALALISMGLFIGSSILCTTNMEPRILEVPILGVLGYIGAFLLGVYVIWVTLKSRHKMKNNQKAD